MIDMNQAIATSRGCMRSSAEDLYDLAHHFAATGNNFVADRLILTARSIEGSSKALSDAWSGEITRVQREDSKVLRDTVMAAFGASA